jgi:hypothetical protein
MLASIVQSALIVVFLLLVLFECLQTMAAANVPGAMPVSNPLARWLAGLSEAGARRDGIVMAYFLVATGAMLGLAMLAGSRHWSLFAGVIGWCIVLELVLVTLNYRRGIQALSDSLLGID